MRILGIDQSLTRCGWCLLSGTRAQPTFVPGSFKSDSVTLFGVKLIELLDVHHPQLVCWERPVPRIFAYSKRTLVGSVTTPNADQLVLPRLAGMIEQACLDRGLAYEEVASNTWRARVLGKGAGNMPTAKAKATALAYAKQLKIPVRNADQAEAALIALYGLSSDQWRLAEQQLRADFADWQKATQKAIKSAPQSSGK